MLSWLSSLRCLWHPGIVSLDGHCYEVAAKAAGHDPAIASLVNLIESSAHAVISKKLLQCVFAIAGRDGDGLPIADAINGLNLLHGVLSSLVVGGVLP